MNGSPRSWLHEYVYGRGFFRRYPYYAAIVARLEPVEDPFVDIMAVSRWGARFLLHVNVEFFRRQPQFLNGVLLHEVHHIVLGHLTLERFRQVAHPDLMEIAMEVSANEFIREPLPGEALTHEAFARYGLRPGQSTSERYDLLAASRRAGALTRAGRIAAVDGHHARGVGSIFRPDEGLDDGGHERLRVLVGEAVAEGRRRLDAAGERPDDGSSRVAGREAGRLFEEIAEAAQPPRRHMDWKAALQMFVGMIRTPRHTYGRPNRRFPEKIGLIPGRMYYPGQVAAQHLLVAIDTSASMSSPELGEIARQLVVLHGLVRLTVVECDSAIQRVYPFKGALPGVCGRGGTDLRPVFERSFLAAHAREGVAPDGVVYFTDGEGPYPEEYPGVKTLWILSKPHEFSCPWGTKAWLCLPPRLRLVETSRSRG